MKPSEAKESAGPRAAGDAKPSSPGTKRWEAKPSPPSELDALHRRIRTLEEERDRLKAEVASVRDKQLRALADYDNLVKRVAKEAQDSTRSAKFALLLRAAVLAETLEKAVKELESKHPGDAKGTKLVLDELRKLLRDEGVREIESLGHAFNFKHHQAVERVETDEKPEGTVLEVIQRGYLVHGDVLRPALVKVAVPVQKGPSKEASAQQA